MMPLLHVLGLAAAAEAATAEAATAEAAKAVEAEAPNGAAADDDADDDAKRARLTTVDRSESHSARTTTMRSV